MNRRSFLKLFAAAGPVVAVAPTYFFAPVGGWLAQPKIDPRLFDYQRRLLEFCEVLTGASPATFRTASGLHLLAAEQRYMLHAYGGYTLHTRSVA